MTEWPHSPPHRFFFSGAYIVTAATYLKRPLFQSRHRLDLLLTCFQRLTEEHEVELHAWAFFPNHYHFIGSSNAPGKLHPFLQHFHSATAKEVNRLDCSSGRRVWFQFWDTCLTFRKSYFARLRYVHENPVHHGLARLASNYPWCSAGWFEREASAGFRKTILAFPCDKVHVPDDFAVSIDQIDQ